MRVEKKNGKFDLQSTKFGEMIIQWGNGCEWGIIGIERAKLAAGADPSL